MLLSHFFYNISLVYTVCFIIKQYDGYILVLFSYIALYIGK